MNNELTYEKASKRLKELQYAKSQMGQLSINDEVHKKAIEIALPILEQQDHEKSIIAGQLEAVRDSLNLTPHQDAIISCAIDRLNLLTSRTLELSRSLIKQQERATNQNGEQ